MPFHHGHLLHKISYKAANHCINGMAALSASPSKYFMVLKKAENIGSCICQKLLLKKCNTCYPVPVGSHRNSLLQRLPIVLKRKISSVSSQPLILLVCFYFLLGWALLRPLASDRILPWQPL